MSASGEKWFSFARNRNMIKKTNLFKRSELGEVAREVLLQEEKTGAKAANTIRYVFSALFLLLIIFNWKTSTPIVNVSGFVFYLSLTMLQTFSIQKIHSRKWNTFISYIGILGDNIIVTGLLLYYTIRFSPDNFSFAVKNPLLWFLLLPVILAGIQFRFRYLFFSIILLLFIYTGLVSYTFWQGVPVTENWVEYVLGPAIIPGDYIANRALTILSISLVMTYMIYRTIGMVQRIGQIQSQKTNLARYFSPDMVAEISEHPDEIDKGSRHEVAVLFLDIRGFTSMSEGLTPEKLAAFLSEFRGLMSSQIFEHGGTLDKYIGDAVMATFGTPVPSQIEGQDVRNALNAALGMLESLKQFNSLRQEQGMEDVRIGIGLHSGEVFAGNIKAGEHVEYSVLGDAVNTAARLESMCKKFKASLLVSENFMQHCDSNLIIEKLPRVILRGKTTPIQIYKLA